MALWTHWHPSCLLSSHLNARLTFTFSLMYYSVDSRCYLFHFCMSPISVCWWLVVLMVIAVSFQSSHLDFTFHPNRHHHERIWLVPCLHWYLDIYLPYVTAVGVLVVCVADSSTLHTWNYILFFTTYHMNLSIMCI